MDMRIGPIHPSWKQIVAVTVVAVMAVTWVLLRIQQSGFGKGEVTIGDRITVSVDVAASAATRRQGLSGRDGLGEDEGMLFIFGTDSPQRFWMKDMRFPLDALWIRDGVLVDLSVSIPPPSEGGEIPVFLSKEPVDAILEVPAGFAARHGLKLGLPVAYRIDRYGGLR
jgi:uncharacterized membrane protein (UPF0127 family)